MQRKASSPPAPQAHRETEDGELSCLPWKTRMPGGRRIAPCMAQVRFLLNEVQASGKQVPQSAKSFLYKNRSRVLSGQLEKHVKDRHLTGACDSKIIQC